jgi:lysozyme
VERAGASPARSWSAWRMAIAAALIVLALSAGFWFSFVANWRPPLGQGETYGVDVSHHQGVIDWDGVATDGITFAYIKATEGGDFGDTRFDENWAGAANAGIRRGAYHFFTLCTRGVAQAEWFVSTAAPEPDALPPAVDLELAGNCSARPDPEEVYRELDAFLEIVEDAWGQPTVLYVGADWEGAYPVQQRLDRPLWLHRFLVPPDAEWWIWQLHGYAHVEGIDGNADINVGRIGRTRP